MHDELNFASSVGPAKRLQRDHGIVPADLAVLIAAAFPDPAEQEAAERGPRPFVPPWPWPGDSFARRLAEARAVLAERGAVRPRVGP